MALSMKLLIFKTRIRSFKKRNRVFPHSSADKALKAGAVYKAPDKNTFNLICEARRGTEINVKISAPSINLTLYVDVAM